jgi:hypothetical protein
MFDSRCGGGELASTKLSLGALLVAFTLFATPIAANAAPSVFNQSGSFTPIYLDGDDEDEDEDEEDEDEENEDDRHEKIPPVFVVPGAGHGKHKEPKKEHPTFTNIVPESLVGTQAIITEVGSDSEFVMVASNDPGAASALGQANPHQSNPIQIGMVKTSRQTPADRFMESAYLGMGVLAAAAAALGLTAAIRAVRIRRSGKSDYFYNGE